MSQSTDKRLALILHMKEVHHQQQIGSATLQVLIGLHRSFHPTPGYSETHITGYDLLARKEIWKGELT